MRWRRRRAAGASSAAGTDAEAAPEPRQASGETRKWLYAILGVQVMFALILFGSDLARVLPLALSPSSAPSLTQPARPGDQTRRYSPARISPREAPPGSRPLPATDTMPTRLLAEFTTWQDAPALVLTGQIAPGDAARLAEELTLEPPLRVFLNSPGGSVADALAIGDWLREAGVDTAMTQSDICLSACPYILAAGTERTVEEGAWVGVHQHYFDENTALPAFLAVSDIQRGQGEVMAYLIEMGVDPGLMQPALMTPPEEIYLLLPEELDRYDLVTTPDDLPEAPDVPDDAT
ncbi:ATP-dependent Clp protease proteolytic subunit [Wenxinia marina]|uniref:Clp protease n=1 Tax=Wenxinia marina DSM 24838 TaxID=1123501 RepID=A0A0D0NJX2_9RHOB|nr:ATP-dependent Clp protease proteolytic subunit [Wenxinia marina]KIQ68620.1 Clp protease [Wenxinia marina DSM 24838]GGL67363.1 hypothetical protein GCM10011392_22350 [Wenxinia marina]